MILVLEPVSLVLEDIQLYHQESILYRSIENVKTKISQNSLHNKDLKFRKFSYISLYYYLRSQFPTYCIHVNSYVG